MPGSPLRPAPQHTWGDSGLRKPAQNAPGDKKKKKAAKTAAPGGETEHAKGTSAAPAAPSGSPQGPLTAPNGRGPPRACAHAPPPLPAFHVATASPVRMRAGRRWEGGEGSGAGHAGKCSFRRGAAAAGPVGFLYTIKCKVVQKRCPPVIPAAPSNSCCSLGGVHLANKHKDPSVPQPWPLAPHFTSQNLLQMYFQALRTLNNSQNKSFSNFSSRFPNIFGI